MFNKIYSPVKQLVAAFNPDNETGFKRVVMIEDVQRGYTLGFLTREFTADRGRGPERLLAVFVPTNHLYLGDIVICEPAHAVFPDISVDDGIRIFLTGGMALPPKGTHIIPAFAQLRPFGPAQSCRRARRSPQARRSNEDGMIVTVQRWLGRGSVALLTMVLALGVMTSKPLSAAQPGQPAVERSAQTGGGEATLVLPDLSTVAFRGVNGRTLLMGGLLVCALGLRSVSSSSLSSRTCRSTLRCARCPS